MVALAPFRTALRNGDQYTQIWTRLRLLLVRYCRSVHGPARAIRSCRGVEGALDVSCTSLRGCVARRRTRHFRDKGSPFFSLSSTGWTVTSYQLHASSLHSVVICLGHILQACVVRRTNGSSEYYSNRNHMLPNHSATYSGDSLRHA